MLTVDLAELPTLVGRDLGYSDWMVVDQDRINGFADATGDHQWIHVDVPRATAALGGTIAHGFLTLSLLAAFSYQTLEVRNAGKGLNYGFNKIRFLAPVPAGSRVRSHQTLDAVEEKGGGWLLTRTVTIEIEGQEKPALMAEWLTAVYP
ncbi:MaoC family dehydratase [Nitrospirillum sp. BR 11163]|uniref:MaoC family dehydratase n=1 Tax=Nitrospirillum sp. BR 11163 TaxID=3104323 RepID=UPI002AFE57FA|nr:MaoC family dehydratase [Nitrospirillum sp. BR 11163]MEA1673016.1 MaoC family dehydratase [Nitrospirillum sp. BR 11163]